jgi:hypothetical protein
MRNILKLFLDWVVLINRPSAMTRDVIYITTLRAFIKFTRSKLIYEKI